MKQLITLFYKLTTKDFNKKVESARQTTSMIISSTNGSLSHFYNDRGEKIRGWGSKTYKFTPQHPLITKYQ
jgi:hypothetical protein